MYGIHTRITNNIYKYHFEILILKSYDAWNSTSTKYCFRITCFDDNCTIIDDNWW